MQEIDIDKLAEGSKWQGYLHHVKEAYDEESITCFLLVEKYGKSKALEYIEDYLPDVSVKRVWEEHDNILNYLKTYITQEQKDVEPDYGSGVYDDRLTDAEGFYNGPRVGPIYTVEDNCEYDSNDSKEDCAPDYGYLEDMPSGDWN